MMCPFGTHISCQSVLVLVAWSACSSTCSTSRGSPTTTSKPGMRWISSSPRYALWSFWWFPYWHWSIAPIHRMSWNHYLRWEGIWFNWRLNLKFFFNFDLLSSHWHWLGPCVLQSVLQCLLSSSESIPIPFWKRTTTKFHITFKEYRRHSIGNPSLGSEFTAKHIEKLHGHMKHT